MFNAEIQSSSRFIRKMKKSFKNDCEQAQLTKLATDVEATTQMCSEKWL